MARMAKDAFTLTSTPSLKALYGEKIISVPVFNAGPDHSSLIGQGGAKRKKCSPTSRCLAVALSWQDAAAAISASLYSGMNSPDRIRLVSFSETKAAILKTLSWE